MNCESCGSYHIDCEGLDPDQDSCEDFEHFRDQFDRDDEYDEDFRLDFADPGSGSALRAATPSNPRIYQCPTCHKPNRLTRKDVALHYQCDECADQLERGY